MARKSRGRSRAGSSMKTMLGKFALGAGLTFLTGNKLAGAAGGYVLGGLPGAAGGFLANEAAGMTRPLIGGVMNSVTGAVSGNSAQVYY